MRRLLTFEASDRITASRALEHAYFRADGRGYSCPRVASCARGSDAGGEHAGLQEYEFEDEALANCPRGGAYGEKR